MEGFRFAFVVLHYMVLEETTKCINYIKKNIKGVEYHIIVVDNASPNNSGEMLKKLYKDDSSVNVILNDNNLGFSKGNNIGFRYAKEIIKSDFIVMMNNDLFITDDNFIKKILEDYNEYSFAVLGPRIYTFEDKAGHQNPMGQLLTKDSQRIKYLESRIKDLKFAILFSYANADILFYRLKFKIGNIVKGDKRKVIDYDSLQKNVTLHGSIWVFSPQYISAFDGLEEITFMYNEEMILYRQILNCQLISIYDPKIRVLHAEKVATLSLKKKKSSARRLRYQRELMSAKTLVAYLKG